MSNDEFAKVFSDHAVASTDKDAADNTVAQKQAAQAEAWESTREHISTSLAEVSAIAEEHGHKIVLNGGSETTIRVEIALAEGLGDQPAVCKFAFINSMLGDAQVEFFTQMPHGNEHPRDTMKLSEFGPDYVRRMVLAVLREVSASYNE